MDAAVLILRSHARLCWGRMLTAAMHMTDTDVGSIHNAELTGHAALQASSSKYASDAAA